MDTLSHGIEVMNDLIPLSRDLRHVIPGAMKAFAGLHTAVMAPGAPATV